MDKYPLEEVEVLFSVMTSLQWRHCGRTIAKFECDIRKSSKANIGVDIRILDLIDFNVESYYDHRYDIMVADGNITSGFFGATASNSPSGIVNNYGVEVGMNVGKQMKDFFFNVNAQLAFARNKIVNMNEAFNLTIT